MLKTVRSAVLGAAFGSCLFFGIVLASDILVNKQQEDESATPLGFSQFIQVAHRTN